MSLFNLLSEIYLNLKFKFILPKDYFIYLTFSSMSFTVNLPPEYGWVLLCAAVMGFSIILIGFLFPGRARGKIFTETYMKQNFGAEHLRVTGK